MVPAPANPAVRTRSTRAGEQVTTHDGHWLIVQEIVQQAEATKAGIVKAKHVEAV